MKNKPLHFDSCELERKFKNYSDEDLEFSKVQLAHEINSTRLQLELINAEIERRHHE